MAAANALQITRKICNANRSALELNVVHMASQNELALNLIVKGNAIEGEKVRIANLRRQCQ